VARRICAPLRLTATGTIPDPDTARGHDQYGFPYPYADYTLLPGAIGLLSSPRDLARFLAAQLDPGSTPLGPAIRLSRAVHTPPGCRRPSGLGWRLKTTGDATLAWHRGLTHGFAAMLALTTAPGHPCGLAILTNSPHTDGLQATGLNALR
jgi:serine-type D-Ala-D-Ala carboxypeptidase/endopeptidase